MRKFVGHCLAYYNVRRSLELSGYWLIFGKMILVGLLGAWMRVSWGLVGDSEGLQKNYMAPLLEAVWTLLGRCFGVVATWLVAGCGVV